jgi:hypothetical protein
MTAQEKARTAAPQTPEMLQAGKKPQIRAGPTAATRTARMRQEKPAGVLRQRKQAEAQQKQAKTAAKAADQQKQKEQAREREACHQSLSLQRRMLPRHQEKTRHQAKWQQGRQSLRQEETLHQEKQGQPQK